MKVINGTTRETTIMMWMEILEKHIKRSNDSMECFRRFSESSDLERLIEDCEVLLENAKLAKEAVDYMDIHGIK